MAGTAFHTTVNLRGYRFEDFTLTVALNTTITKDDVGKALSWDTAAANRMKLAADGDPIAARLDVFEDRTNVGEGKVGTAEFKFSSRLPIKSGQTVVVGDTAVGAGGGEIKAAGIKDYDNNYVAAIDGTYAIVVKL